ncbi:hypothetical protein [Streptomyces sp. NPDC001604]|uniref:hypothetical protein n=1 Tax=Streptomyces sp. NPDC001604 TaxID=3364593 RepID=UPI003682B828
MSVTLVHPRPKFAPAHLTEPPPSGYLHIAAAVEPPGGIGRPGHSRGKTHLLDLLRAEAEDLASLGEVKRASVYRAAAVAPTVGLHPSDTVHPARYDVVVLVETRAPQDIDQVLDSAAYRHLRRRLEQAAGDLHVMTARCAKCLADVGRSQEGLFQFSYFVGDDPELIAELWEHLAGWYAAETGLDNSLLLQPLDGTTSVYCFVGHAHWDLSLAAVALRQFTKPSFYRFLQPTLKENRTTVMPVLYHLVRLRDR